MDAIVGTALLVGWKEHLTATLHVVFSPSNSRRYIGSIEVTDVADWHSGMPGWSVELDGNILRAYATAKHDFFSNPWSVKFVYFSADLVQNNLRTNSTMELVKLLNPEIFERENKISTKKSVFLVDENSDF